MSPLRADPLAYSLPLARPVAGVRRREGWLLRLTDEGGRQGLGDAACWPGFGGGPARVARGLAWLVERSALARVEVDAPEEAEAAAAALAAAGDLAPEVRHAVEQALLDLLARRRGLPLARLLHAAPRARVPVHHLVGDVPQAEAALAGGARCLKLKVGADPDQAVALTRAVRAAAPAGVGLRVDVNGAWDVPSARRALAALEGLDLEWVEQPLPPAAIVEQARLRAETSLRLACDEGVAGAADLERVLASGAADVVVLKPMFCGGLLPARSLARRAAAAGLAVCLTHALESAVGRAGALHLAAATPEVGLACGLTQPLARDLATAPRERDGFCELPQGAGLGIGNVRAGALTPSEVA